MTGDKRHTSIFDDSHHFTREELVRYNQHELSESERHEMEKHLVDCELCTEALNGIAEMKSASMLYEVSKELHLRARRKHLLKKRIFSQNELIAIFAVVFLVLFLTVISIFFFSKSSQKKVPMEENKIEQKK